MAQFSATISFSGISDYSLYSELCEVLSVYNVKDFNFCDGLQRKLNRTTRAIHIQHQMIWHVDICQLACTYNMHSAVWFAIRKNLIRITQNEIQCLRAKWVFLKFWQNAMHNIFFTHVFWLLATAQLCYFSISSKVDISYKFIGIYSVFVFVIQ